LKHKLNFRLYKENKDDVPEKAKKQIADIFAKQEGRRPRIS
jgi:hypothetical protein